MAIVKSCGLGRSGGDPVHMMVIFWWRACRRFRGPAASMLAVCLGLLGRVTDLEGQVGDATLIREPGACSECRIVMERELRLGDRQGEGLLGDRGGLYRLPDGRYLAVTFPESHRVQVFDPTGTWLEAFGRRGHGPGEWGSVGQLLSSTNAVYVHDIGRARIHVLDHEFRRIGEFALPYTRLGGSAQVVGDTLIVFSQAALPAPELMGVLYHLVDMDGRHVRSFGETDGPVDPWSAEEHARRIHYAGHGILWAVSVRIQEGRYRLERWSLETGRLLGRWVREGPGLRPPESLGAVPEGLLPPSPSVRYLTTDGNGLLWVFSTVPVPDWQDGMTRTTDGAGWRMDDPNRVYDTVIDVIDPAKGQLLATRRFEGSATWSLLDGTPRIPVRVVDAAGHNFYEVWRLELRR